MLGIVNDTVEADLEESRPRQQCSFSKKRLGRVRNHSEAGKGAKPQNAFGSDSQGKGKLDPSEEHVDGRIQTGNSTQKFHKRGRCAQCGH